MRQTRVYYPKMYTVVLQRAVLRLWPQWRIPIAEINMSYYLENKAFSMKMVFMKIVLKWIILSINRVEITKAADAVTPYIDQKKKHKTSLIIISSKHITLHTAISLSLQHLKKHFLNPDQHATCAYVSPTTVRFTMTGSSAPAYRTAYRHLNIDHWSIFKVSIALTPILVFSHGLSRDFCQIFKLKNYGICKSFSKLKSCYTLKNHP